jgi:cell division septal protein FtsQ
MEAEKNLGQALLNRRSPEEIQHSDAERTKVMDTIRRDKRDIRILKRVLAICLAAVALFGAGAMVIVAAAGWPEVRSARAKLHNFVFIVGRPFAAILFVAVAATIILAVMIYLRTRRVSNLQIQGKLLELQEEIRKLSEAKRQEG